MNLNDFIEELRPLVNTDCGTSTPAGVAKIAVAMQQKYLDMGWHAELVDLGSAVGPGVMATNKPGAEHYDVLLVGHMDTVFPEGTAAARPLSIDGNIARGPGVADMKAGLLNIAWALRGLDQSTLARLAICVTMNPDEETGSVHSHDWIGSYAKKSKCVLVAEAARTDGTLVKARKGVGMYQIDFKGVAAHAGNDHEKGRSAITEMAHWTLAMNALTDYAAGTTVNVGKVSGGTATNVVPEDACAQIDIRFWKTSEFEKVERALFELQKTPFTPGVTVSLKRLSFMPAMEVSHATEDLMKTVEAAGAAMGLPIGWKAVGGGSDANHTAALGIPSLDGLGPIGGNFHNEHEYLELDSVLPRIQLLQNVLQRL